MLTIFLLLACCAGWLMVLRRRERLWLSRMRLAAETLDTPCTDHDDEWYCARMDVRVMAGGQARERFK